MKINIKNIELVEDMVEIEDIQRRVWVGSETEVVPAHILVAIVKYGGILIGAYIEKEGVEQCAGFVFGFPGFYTTPDGPRPMHCSDMLAVLPEYRNQGLGYRLKRAQWQMVRNQGLDRIIWTYDPLMSRNAHLNINKLGAVCNLYLRNFFGELQDSMNFGLATDRFQVDWWVNTNRVKEKLSRTARKSLSFDHYMAAGVTVVNPARQNSLGFPCPSSDLSYIIDIISNDKSDLDEQQFPALLLVEIPSDFLTLKEKDPSLARNWREHTRNIFEALFEKDYLVTDLVYSPGEPSRSYYVLSYGKSTL
ncbi:MAG: GNAT family N-acetyltransferase [Anaerolineales bacterium]|nr:GNAT family N-acetyltransferase [Anaerolineales bacterium]